jgi:hypothetical protein
MTDGTQPKIQYTLDRFFWYVSKKNHLLKVDVSITNESLTIYEALEAIQTHKALLVWMYKIFNNIM